MMTLTRRTLLAAPAALAARATAAPTAPVAIARCNDYGSSLAPTLARMFDQLGGLGALVRNKTVAIKINLTGGPQYRLGYLPAELAHWTHPALIGATVRLMGEAGARRIRVLESPWATIEPIEDYTLAAGWEPRDILGAASRVEFVNTNWLERWKKYSYFAVPNGGHMFKGFLLNPAYEECDVFVSIAKLKEHATTGITLSMKNCFGNTPCTIYGEGSPKDEPSVTPQAGRSPFHNGNRQPSSCAPAENDPKSPRDGGYRVPRIVADIVASRPIHLAILDGIATMTHGEGPWVHGSKPITPRVLVAGLNPVNTDAVGAAVMGFDPMTLRGKAPFERCDNMLELAERHGVGTRDLKRIEVAGTPLREVAFSIRGV